MFALTAFRSLSLASLVPGTTTQAIRTMAVKASASSATTKAPAKKADSKAPAKGAKAAATGTKASAKGTKATTTTKTKAAKPVKVKKEKPVKVNPKKLPALDFPKRPSTPWNLFYMEHLAKVKAAGKQIVPTAETAAASLIWKELSPSQKQVYDETYRANFENYKKLISARLQELTPAEFKLENTRRQALRAAGKRSLPALKDPNAPKRPLSSFFSFAKDQRDAGKFSDLAQKDQARAFAKVWKELSEEQRRRYEEQTRAALEVFKQDKARYESGV